MSRFDQLSAAHRRKQLSIKARFLRDFLPLWPILRWDALDDTFGPWVRAVKGVVAAHRQDSANAAVSYYEQLRAVSVPRAPTKPPIPVFVSSTGQVSDQGLTHNQQQQVLRVADRRTRERRPTIDWGDMRRPVLDWSEADKAVERALLVTGPGELKRRSGLGQTETKATSEGFVTASGAASRHVLAGSRTTSEAMIEADDQAFRYMRQTDADPCSFCAMLASRGAVYLTSASAGFHAHDHCQCTVIPIFVGTDWRSTDAGRKAMELQALWQLSTVGTSGRDARNAFRRALEGQRRGAMRKQPARA